MRFLPYSVYSDIMYKFQCRCGRRFKTSYAAAGHLGGLRAKGIAWLEGHDVKVAQGYYNRLPIPSSRGCVLRTKKGDSPYQSDKVGKQAMRMRAAELWRKAKQRAFYRALAKRQSMT